MKILSIDPSVNNFGYGTLEINLLPGSDQWDEDDAEWLWGDIQVEGYNYPGRCQMIAHEIALKIGEFDILVAEWPQFYNTGAGHSAAMKGYTINLAGIVMYLVGYFQMKPNDVNLITAPEWKGSVAKHVTRRRFFRSFGIDKSYKISEHAVDATMLLYYWAKENAYIT